MKKRRKKMPWMPFWTLDWLGDTRQLTNRQKGIWIDLLAYMWMAKPRGKITANWDSIARMVGEPWLECESEIREIARKNVLEMSECDALVTLSSRRMIDDEKKRESHRLNVTKNREVHKRLTCDAFVTGRSQKSEVRSHIKDKDLKISSSPPKPEPDPPTPHWKELVDHFVTRWQAKRNAPFNTSGVAGARFFRELKGLARVYTPWGCMALWDAFLASDDPFVKNAGYSFPVFVAQIPRLLDAGSYKSAARAYEAKLCGPVGDAIQGLAEALKRYP